jgi:acetoin utilization deacetylase AcuC-like enzyme
MTEYSTRIVYDQIFLQHDKPGHPENANRLRSIISELIEKKLFEQAELIKSRAADVEEITICHKKEYVEYVKKFSEKGGGYFDPDTYSNKYSFKSAAIAVGSSIDLTKSVISGKIRNGFALVRPPGHHALANRSMGFCLFGNIAIAAKFALTKQGINKVAIVDFDVHHGNGTEALVGKDPNILFISSHQYPFYPGSGSINDIGTGDAEGTIVNIPLQAGVGDEGFRMIYEKIVIPSLERFSPDLILVSAGYDAHWDDPLANLTLSLTGFDWISRKLIDVANKICDGKIIFFLEGGYNLNVLKFGVTNSIRALMEIEEFEDPIGKTKNPEEDVKKIARELIKIHNL